MAKQVENRVVEMEFKNKDFEKAIAVTMESLDELNKKLDDLNKINTSGFDKLTESANNVDFSKLSASIDYIASRFSVVGIAVQGVKQRIVEEMAQAATSINQVFSKIEDTIAEKGKTRALNIAQAKFQLQGLGVAWKDVEESINTAVNDTRFGLDEAAMAASQLKASGVQLGDSMTHALLGISGVASMTNAEYSEIARIFTSIAGVGKVYRQQLNMISSRGLNATAAIAKYLGTSEAAVNEMISSKDDFIDFTTFAEAMFSEFGEQATKANDLFTGAFANAKAALGRIGAKFYTPFYEYARQVLVSVKPVINDINAELDTMFSSLDKTMAGITNVVNKALEEIHKSFTEEGYNIDLFGKTINTKDEFDKIVNWVAGVLDGITATIGGSNGLSSVLGDTFLMLFLNIYDVLKAIGDAIFDVFGAPTMGDVIHAIQKFHDFVEETRLSEEQLENLKRTLRGVTSFLSILLKTADAIYRVFFKPILKNLGFVSGEVLDLTGNISDMLYEFDQSYDPFGPLYNAVSAVYYKILPFINAVKELGTAIKEAFVELTGIDSIETLFNKIEKLGQDLHIADIFYAIGGAIVWALNMLVSFKDTLEQDGSFKDFVKGLVEQNSVLGWIKQKWDGLKKTLDDLFHKRISLTQALGLDKLKEAFPLLTEVFNTLKEHYKSIFEAYKGEDGKEGLPFIQQFGENLKKAIKDLKWEDIYGLIGASFFAFWKYKSVEIQSHIAETFGKFHDTFQKLADGITLSLGKMTKETNAEKILKIAAAIALLSASVLLLGRMDPGELQQGIKYIAILMAAISTMVFFLSKIMKTTEELEDEYHTYAEDSKERNHKKSIFGLGKKNIVEIITSKVGASLTDGVKKVKKTIKDLSSIPALILSLGVSIALITSSLTKLFKVTSDIRPEKIWLISGMFGIIFVGFGVMVGALMWFITKHKDDLNSETIDTLSKMFLFFGIAIRLISGAISALTLVSSFAGVDNLLTAAGSIAVLIGLMALICARLVEVSSKNHGGYKNILAAGGVMIMMAAAIQMLTIPIVAITLLTKYCDFSDVLSSIGIIEMFLIVMGGLAYLMGKEIKDMEIAGMLSGAMAMVIMAAAINMMIIPLAAITALAHYRPDELWAAMEILGIIAAVMTIIISVFSVAGGSGLGAVGMIAGAAAMVLLAVAIQKMALALAGLVALESLMPGGVETFFKDLAAGLALLWNGKVQGGLWLTAIAVGVLGTAMILFGTGVLEFGAGIKFVCDGILAFVGALFLLQAIDFETLGQNLANGGAALIHGFVQAMTGGLPDVVQGFVLLIGAGCDAIAKSSSMLGEAVVVLLADVIVAIDNHSQDLGWGLGHALANILWYAMAGIFASTYDFFGRALGLEEDEGMTTLLKNRLLNKNDNLTEAEAKEMTMDVGRGLGKKLFENLFDGFLIASDEASYFDRLKVHFNNKLQALVKGFDWAGLLSSLTTGGLGGLGNALAVRGGKKVAHGWFSLLFGSNSEETKKEVKDAVEPAAENIADQTAELTSESLASTDNQQKVGEGINDMLGGAADKYIDKDSFMKMFGDTGEDGATSFTDSFMKELGMDNISDPSSMAEEIMKQYDAGGAIGLEKYHETEDAAEKKADRVNDRTAKRYGIASPSKVYEQFGKYIDQGLAKGLNESDASEDAMDNKASGLIGMFDSLSSTASKSIDGSALSTLRDTILNLAEVATSDMDYTPTIAPVMDMSNITSGFQTLDSMFSRSRSIALAGDVTNLNDANRMLSLQLQNDNSSTLNNSLMGLRGDVERLGTAMMNTQMVMDTGEVVGVMASPMDRELGRRAIQVKRGGARR